MGLYRENEIELMLNLKGYALIELTKSFILRIIRKFEIPNSKILGLLVQ